VFHNYTRYQGCSLGLERLEKWNVSDLRVQCLSLISVLRVWQNVTSRSRLGLEDITSQVSGFVTLRLAMQQACGYQEENNGFENKLCDK